MTYEGLIGSDLVNTVVVQASEMKSEHINVQRQISWCELKAMRKGNSVMVE